MLNPTHWWAVIEPADLRCGMDRLLAQVQALSQSAVHGAAYVFRNRAGTRLKIVCVDGNGVWLCVRRLHRGGFVWPRPGDAICTLTAEQMGWLSMGVDWQRLSQKVVASTEL